MTILSSAGGLRVTCQLWCFKIKDNVSDRFEKSGDKEGGKQSDDRPMTESGCSRKWRGVRSLLSRSQLARPPPDNIKCQYEGHEWNFLPTNMMIKMLVDNTPILGHISVAEGW